jgi:hypothetical protein
LWPGKNYCILSQESGADTWYNSNTHVTTTGDAVVGSGAYLSGSIVLGDGGANSEFGPVDFKYNLGVPGGLTQRGSPFAGFGFSNNVFVSQVGPVVVGTVLFHGVWGHGNATPGDTFTYQWILDGSPISPLLTGTDAALPWSCDTIALGISDGTHIIYPRLLDVALTPIYNLDTTPTPIVVANSGFNAASQTIPVAVKIGNRGPSPVPDYVNYDASDANPRATTYPLPSTFMRRLLGARGMKNIMSTRSL